MQHYSLGILYKKHYTKSIIHNALCIMHYTQCFFLIILVLSISAAAIVLALVARHIEALFVDKQHVTIVIDATVSLYQIVCSVVLQGREGGGPQLHIHIHLTYRHLVGSSCDT